MPPISFQQSSDILFSVKADVNDFFSITANHFIHAGHAGISHFHFLLSAIINNVNLVGLDKLNTAWSCILYKGHLKDKESDRFTATYQLVHFWRSARISMPVNCMGKAGLLFRQKHSFKGRVLLMSLLPYFSVKLFNTLYLSTKSQFMPFYSTLCQPMIK